MDLLELFLREHASVHTTTVAPSSHNAEWMFAGLADEQWRALPHGFNSIAWLFWHVARVEDSCVAGVLMGVPQVFDEGDWPERLNVARRDDGEGMSKDEVAALSEAIDVAALREYRDAVGKRTREHAQALWPDRWSAPLTAADVQRVVDSGAMPADEAGMLDGAPREQFLNWWSLHHTYHHLGQIAMVRAAVKS